jgi:hypothetical protein
MQGASWLIFPLSNGRIFARWFLLAALRAGFLVLGFLLYAFQGCPWCFRLPK